MNSTILNRLGLFRSGLFLIVAGLVGGGISALGIRNTFVEQGGKAPAALAEGISGTLLPGAVGQWLFWVGVIMVAYGWIRSIRSQSIQ